MGGADNHTYMPVRFISVHSELDRNAMINSLDVFNSPDNTYGHRIMILIGGKIIKEAFDLKAIREIMIMSRPDNIPTLIQILGRGVRKNSHKYLKETERNVNIRIFTSCLPIKTNGVYGLGHEEEKYVEKLKYYKIIQNIEKTLHENSIDALVNYDIIRGVGKKTENKDELGSLPYEPAINSNVKTKVFKLNELNLKTFNVFNYVGEINNIMMIIKRLFIEKSSVWVYNDLLYAVKNARRWFNVEFNTLLIDEELFILALTRLVFNTNKHYVEPYIKYIQNTTKNLHKNSMDLIIDKLFDSEDRIIILPGDQKSVITQVGAYYILFHFD